MTYEFTLRRIFDASVEEVFDAITDPVGQREWWTEGVGFVDTGGDVRIGCTTFVEWDTDDGHRCRAEQTFVEIDRPRRLVFKETVNEPGVPPYECTLTMTFEDEDGKTSYTLHHTGFPTVEERDRHERGTGVFCDRLAKYLAGQRVR
jgi:glutathione S-transferase